MEDLVPMTWVDGAGGTPLTDANFNTEIRNAYQLLLNPPTCQLHEAGGQSFATAGTWYAVSWDTVNFDTEAPADPMYAAGNPTRITCRTSGWYYVNAAVGLGNADTAVCVGSMAARKNGSTYYNMGSSRAQASRTLYMTGSTLIPLTADTDYLELMVGHTSASSMSLSLSAYFPLFTAIRWRGL